MRKLMMALGCAALVAPTLVATTHEAEARRHAYKEWRGKDGRIYCRKSNGTTGTIVGAVGGALVGRTIDTRGDRTLGTVVGGVGGALLGREVERSASTRRCR